MRVTCCRTNRGISSASETQTSHTIQTGKSTFLYAVRARALLHVLDMAAVLALRFKQFLERRPYTATTVVATITLTAGDILAQNIQHIRGNPPGPYDAARTLRMAAGSLITGPFSVLWFRSLDRVIGSGNTPRLVATKVMLQSVLYAPVQIGMIFGIPSILEGASSDEIRQRLSVEIPKAWKVGILFWPFVHVLSFSFVPLLYRPLALNLVAVCWNAFLCMNRSSASASTSARPITTALPAR